MIAKEKILDRLSKAMMPLAVHEMKIEGYSENNIATRLSELAREGKVIGAYRKGTSFKEWQPIRKQEFKVEASGQMIFT